MLGSTKATAKSCSCVCCKRGQSTACGNSMKKSDERAYRHAAKVALTKEEDPIINHGPKGNYFD